MEGGEKIIKAELLVAYRTAMRVLPLVPANYPTASADPGDLLFALRALLSAGCLLLGGKANVSKAALLASVERFSLGPLEAARSANDAAFLATVDEKGEFNAASEAALHVAAGAAYLFVPVDVGRVPANYRYNVGGDFAASAPHIALRMLVQTEMAESAVGVLGDSIAVPRALEAAIDRKSRGQRSLLYSENEWSFWGNWYDRAMAGDHLPWDLQEAIALISHETWEAGPEAVAEEIRRIQLDFVSKSLPQAGGIGFDDDAGVFRKVVAEVARPPLLGATLAQVEGALEDVLADPTNGLHERSREVQVLTRMLERFGNDPQRIEMDCTSVYGSMTRQLASEELPPSEQNLALREAVSQVAEGIRATDPEIAENRRILSEVKFRDMGEEGIAALKEALPVLEAVSDEELGGEFREDIRFLADTYRLPDKPVLGTEPRNPGIKAAYDEEIRVFKRVADMAILAKTGEAIHTIDGSAIYKGARIVVTGAGLAALLTGLVVWIAALF